MTTCQPFTLQFSQARPKASQPGPEKRYGGRQEDRHGAAPILPTPSRFAGDQERQKFCRTDMKSSISALLASADQSCLSTRPYSLKYDATPARSEQPARNCIGHKRLKSDCRMLW